MSKRVVREGEYLLEVSHSCCDKSSTSSDNSQTVTLRTDESEFAPKSQLETRIF